MPRENPYPSFTNHFGALSASTMFTLIAQFIDWIRQPTPAHNDYAHALLESAEARAGTNPRQAHELRLAASAYISVVR